MPPTQMQRWADSAGLKIASYLLMAVFMPLVSWNIGKALDRLERVENLLNASATQSALVEQRLQTLEKLVPQRQAAIDHLTELTLKHEFELQQLQAIANHH